MRHRQALACRWRPGHVVIPARGRSGISRASPLRRDRSEEKTIVDITLNTPKLFGLSGRSALVTGAGSGIGQRVAIGLAQCGIEIACLDRRSDFGLADTVGMIEGAARKAIAITADVTSRASMGDAAARTEAELGILGIAANAAGIANANPAGEMSEEQYQTLLDISMKSVFCSCQGGSPGHARARQVHDHQHRVDVGRDREPRTEAGAPQRFQGRRDPNVEIHADRSTAAFG